MIRQGTLARVAIAAIVGSMTASAQANAERQLALTIYNGDLALVEDTRSIDVKAGRSRLELEDVSGAIRPETVTIAAPGLSIVEQNFDFDLVPDWFVSVIQPCMSSLLAASSKSAT